MIRTAQPRDLARILEIYDYARGFMERTGNASQWGKHFPPEELLREDIRAQRLFVIEENGAHGCPHAGAPPGESASPTGWRSRCAP